MFSDSFTLSGDTGQGEVLSLVEQLNADSRFHGILVQLPLPSQLDTQKIIESVDPDKDVDGIHPYNVGKLVQGRPDFIPGDAGGHPAVASAERLRSRRQERGYLRP